MHCDGVRLGHIRRAKGKYPIIFFMRTDNFLILIMTPFCKPNYCPISCLMEWTDMSFMYKFL